MKDLKNTKKNVAVIFGGKSVEHDISIITGVQTLNSLDKNKYNIYPIYISKDENWYTSNNFFNIKTFAESDFLHNKNIKKISLINGGILLLHNKKKPTEYAKINFAFLSTHGGSGEKGALQGFLDMCGVAYSSPNVFSSSICMNKFATKILLNFAGINTTNFKLFLQEDYNEFGYKFIEDNLQNLNYPLIVKPCNLGSSVGITFCKDTKHLKDAISFAFLFDSQVLVEEVVENLREVNLSVLGNTTSLETSVIEEVNISDDFLTFENKYLGNGSSKGMENTGRTIPAELDEETQKQVIEFGVKAYKLLNCKGLVRIDFLINTKTNKVYLNEINTIPGSLSNYLWKDKNYTFTELLNKLLEYSEEEKTKEQSKVTNFSSNVLSNFEKCDKLDFNK